MNLPTKEQVDARVADCRTLLDAHGGVSVSLDWGIIVALADALLHANKTARAAQERADATLAICVYCGKRQARSDTAAVFAHWETCEKHPAREALSKAQATKESP